MSDTAYVATLPTCDVIGCNTQADYDVRTLNGQWANLCQTHFDTMTDGTLGTGYGQRLIVAPPTPPPAEPGTVGAMLEAKERRAQERQRRADIRAEMLAAIDAGDFEAAFDACGDEDPIAYL